VSAASSDRVGVEGALLAPVDAPVSADPAAGLVVSLRLRGKRALIVGGGPVAAQRARVALGAGAVVHVVALDPGVEIVTRAQRGELTLEVAAWRPEHVDGAAIVLAAVDDSDVSEAVAAVARARGVPVNCADIPPLCDFYLPAVHQDGPVQIAVSTGGEGPALAARLRDWIAGALPAGMSRAVRRVGQLRRAVRAHDPGPEATARRMGFLKALSSRLSWEALAEVDVDAVLAAYPELPAEAAPAPAAPLQVAPALPEVPAHAVDPCPAGAVTLVGAGPGDPDLLTVGAARALAAADLVLADRLIPEAILALATGEVVIAAKPRGLADEGQAELDRAAVEGARRGLRVVRLKIGDPGLFGRLGEELATYAAAGIPARALPGVSAALAAPVLAGVVPTLRGVADQVWIGTGHGAGDDAASLPAWRPGTTWVWLMAVHRLDALVSGLRERGFPDDLPCAIVERASRPDQVVTRARLGSLTDAARRAGCRPPAVVVMGAAVEALAVSASGASGAAA
jgi:uroporphyrin-III C-methyltransferase